MRTTRLKFEFGHGIYRAEGKNVIEHRSGRVQWLYSILRCFTLYFYRLNILSSRERQRVHIAHRILNQKSISSTTIRIVRSTIYMDSIIERISII